MLKVDHVSAGYGDLKVLYDVSLEVNRGEVVALVGANGAGKTTLLHIVSGFVPVTSGAVTFLGQDLLKAKPHERAELGIAHIPQGRGILTTLTVEENLIMGAYTKRSRSHQRENMKKAYEMFPILHERRAQAAGSLSGGEQQMLAISRALMMEPNLIIMDEPSLGLAPIVTKMVFEIIDNLARQGNSILLIEQNLIQTLKVATRGYVIETGEIKTQGTGEALLNDPQIRATYLGV